MAGDTRHAFCNGFKLGKNVLYIILNFLDSDISSNWIQGGITSSDLATKALEAQRARVIGQALAGVPLWQLGPESRHPGVPYIVFPGDLKLSQFH